MLLHQEYNIYGYLDFISVETGFVTPVFSRNGALFMEVCSGNRISEFIPLPLGYAGKVILAPGSIDIGVFVGDACCFGFKNDKSIYYGTGDVLSRIIIDLLKSEDFPHAAKVSARNFVNRYMDYNLKKVSVLIVDDHRLILDSISHILKGQINFDVIACASAGGDAMKIAVEQRPEIILMDINMTPVSGFDATMEIRKLSPKSKIIALTMHSMPAYAKKMLQLGAMGYITKNTSKHEMLSGINSVVSGGKYICNEVKNILAQLELDESDDAADLNTLSRREIDIVKLLKDGYSSKEVAAILDISLKTVEVHRYNILKKLQLRNTAELVNFINTKGLK